jgi:hypothetical protein
MAWKPWAPLGALLVASVGATDRKFKALLGGSGGLAVRPVPAGAGPQAGGDGGVNSGGSGGGATVLISCPACHKMNRVASQKLQDGPKCGGCGTLLVGA